MSNAHTRITLYDQAHTLNVLSTYDRHKQRASVTTSLLPVLGRNLAAPLIHSDIHNYSAAAIPSRCRLQIGSARSRRCCHDLSGQSSHDRYLGAHHHRSRSKTQIPVADHICSMAAVSDPPGVGSPAAQSVQEGIQSFLDSAMGYYHILDTDKRPHGSRESLDGYDQVDFFPASGHEFSGANQSSHPSGVARAAQRLKAAKELQVAHLQKLKGHVSARYAALTSLQWTPKRVKLRDKLTFALGVMLALISAFWLGLSPSTFYKLYSIKAMLLFALRFFLYKKSRMHYYLMDFCYYANLLLVVQVWMFNDSCPMEKIMFAFAMGPLAWSIVAFRNSMIFHSLDKMTSLFLHVFPPLVAWAIRWYPGDPHHWNGPGQCEDDTATVRELILVPGIPYALWAVAYYAKIFIISSDRIQARGYETLFKYITRNPNSLPGRITRSLPGWLAPIVFMTWHLVFCFTCFVFAWLMWQHFWLNTIFVLLMIFVSAWNGGNYYFEVFVHRYVTEVGLPSRNSPLARAHSSSLERLGGDEQNNTDPARNVVRANSESALCTEEAAWASAVETSWEMLDGSDFQRPSSNGPSTASEGHSLRQRASADPVQSATGERE